MKFYELVLFMTYYGQRCVNVFNVTMSGVPASVTGSFALAYAFGAILDGVDFPAGSIFEQIHAFVSASVVFNQVRVKNPYDDLDFYSVPFAAGTVGENPGVAMTPTNAYSLFSNQVRLDIQAGQKRFVGVVEESVEGGGYLTAGALSGAQELADRMSDPFTYDDEGNTLTFNIVVAKKYNDLEADPPIRGAYFPTLAEQLANVASGVLWTPRPYTSTQTTRQYGHGR